MSDGGSRIAASARHSGGWVGALAQTRAAGRAFDRGEMDVCSRLLAEQWRDAQGRPMAELVALIASALLRGLSGWLCRARRDLDDAEGRLKELGAAGLGPHWEQAALVCAWMGGDWAAAEARSARLEALPPLPRTLTLGLRVELLRQAGRPDDARGAVARLGELPASAVTAWALAGLDPRPSAALARLRTAASETRPAGQDGIPRPMSGRVGMLPLVVYRLAAYAHRAGDTGAVAEAAARFRLVRRPDPLGRVLAGLTEALASGDPGPAREARVIAEAEGLAPLVAECLTVQGRLGDHPDATLRAALERWRAIGAVPHVRELTLLVGGPRTPEAHLTPREYELATLVQQGLANRAIAAAMHLSVKSVEAYLTRIYTKTGCASRVELAIAAAEGSLPTARD